MNNLLTIQEIAINLNVSTMWVRRLIKSGKLKAVNISQGDERKHYRVRQKDLEEFING